MSIRLSQEAVIGRQRAVSKLIEPLVQSKDRLEVRRLGASKNYVVGLLPKGENPSNVMDPATVRVAAKVDGIFLNYHEVWLPISASADYELERMYLHIHQKRDRTDIDRQVLCFHCDVRLRTDLTHTVHKRLPHLHLLGGDPDLSKAHLPVCVNDVELGGSNLRSLSITFEKTIRMIEEEIFPHYA